MSIILTFICCNVNAELVVNFDSSYPAKERQLVANYHRKVTNILKEITGVDPDTEFTIVYDPSSHLGLENFTTLIDPNLPTGDYEDWYWWYLIEVSHFYIPNIDIWSNNMTLYNKYHPYFNPHMAIREHEYISHALTEYIIINFLYDSEEFKDKIEFYKNQAKAWINPIRDITVKNISPQTIFQVDTNYDNFNAFACDIGGGLFYKLVSIDKNFFKNFFENISNYQIKTIDDYINVLAQSIQNETIDGIDKIEWLKSYPYFTRFDEENLTEYSIDILTFSPYRDNTYPWHRLTYINPNYFIITGSSNRYYSPNGYSVTQIDNNLFGKSVTYVIKDINGNIVYSGNATISENLWSNIVYIPNPSIGKYIIETSYTTSDNFVLKDSVVFYITHNKNIFDIVNNLLIIDNLKYENMFCDIISYFDKSNNIFPIIFLSCDNIGSYDNGYLIDLENIFLEDIIVKNNIFNVKMGYSNESLYIKELF